MMSLRLEWIRPNTVSFPRVWHTFFAKDLNTPNLVEYQVRDLPESRFDDAVRHMELNYLKSEPLTNAVGGQNDSNFADDCKLIWRTLLSQKTVLYCLKVDSDEIVGVNMTYVFTKNDTIVSDVFEICKSQITKDKITTMRFLNKDFDVFQRYNVKEYLGSYGLTVDERFRGRGIGEQLLLSRKPFCKALGLTTTHTCFTSNFSNRIADKVGFTKDVGYTYDQLAAINPELSFPNIESDEITLKSWTF